MVRSECSEEYWKRTGGGGGGGGGEHERSRQEKEARAGWVKNQTQIGVVV